MSATIKDVARHAGVSVGTVSKYINGGSLKEYNRQKIEDAIDDLKFKPNQIAKGLRNAKTYTVVLMLSSINHVFLVDVLNELESYLSFYGYSLIICDSHEDKEYELAKVKKFVERMVDGFILMPGENSEMTVRYLLSENIPVVLFDSLVKDIKTDAVILDNVKATYMATQHLIESGHNDIGIIIGGENHYTSKQRLKGYKKALDNFNIQVNEDFIVNGNYKLNGGKNAFFKLCSSKKKPTAIIITNYEMTFGAFLVINELQITIPDDISLVCFDVGELASITSPKFSVISQPFKVMGKSLGELLYKRMSGDNENFPIIIENAPLFEQGASVKKLD